MKFSVDKTMYSGALEKVKRALSKDKKSVGDEHLQYIYHEATTAGLRLVATDLNKQIEYVIPVGQFLAVHEPGIACPFGAGLADLVKGYPDVKIDIQVKTELIVSSNVLSSVTGGSGGAAQEVQKLFLQAQKSDKRRFCHWVPCVDSNRFPLNHFKLSQGPNLVEMTFSGLFFNNLIRQTEYAAGRDAAIPEYTSIYIQNQNGVVNACASDMKRVAYYIGATDTKGDGKIAIFGPVAKEILGLIDAVNPVNLWTDGHVVCMRQSQQTYFGLLMAAEAPELDDITKITFPITAKVSRQELVEALKNITTVTDHACKLTFRHDTQELELEARGSKDSVGHKGGGTDVVPCEVNATVSLACKPSHLKEALDHSTLDEIVFELDQNPLSPFRFVMGDGYSQIISGFDESAPITVPPPIE